MRVVVVVVVGQLSDTNDDILDLVGRSRHDLLHDGRLRNESVSFVSGLNDVKYSHARGLRVGRGEHVE